MPLNLYADLTEFARQFEIAPLATADAAEIEKAIEAASRRVDEMTRRSFFSETGTRILDGEGRSWQWIPDLLAPTTIKLDEDGDRTFEVTLVAGTDYYLKRRGYKDEDALPATTLELDAINGQRGTLLQRRRLIEFGAATRWGFTEEVEATGDNVRDDPLAAGATTITVLDGTNFAVGQTLFIEAEQLYVSAIAEKAITVVPGVNGTTAASHDQGTVISRFVWVPGVREATLILAGRLWKRRETGYANVIENSVSGQIATFRAFDPDVERFLTPLIRGDALV